MEDDVDAGGELLLILGADGQAGLRQLAADWDDLLAEIGVVFPHSVEKLPDGTEHRLLRNLCAEFKSMWDNMGRVEQPSERTQMSTGIY